MERRGTPVAGIEFSSRAFDGNGVWAWQAKFLFGLDDSGIGRMTASVNEALSHEPG
jgi:hypothetical protein